MPRNIVDAADVRPGKKGWTCIIQVIERHPVLHKELTYFPFQKRYRHYLLTDMKGTKVKAVIFDEDIDFFQCSLLPFNRYKISNATVTVQPEKYQLPDYKFFWTINTKTPIEPIVDSKPYTLPYSFDVCKFTDLHRYAESDTNVAIRGLVVHRFPFIDITGTKSARDYVVVNEEEIPIVIRLWKNLLADYDPDINSGRNNDPVAIIASNLEVKTFHGLSLATRSNTYLIQNPPVAEELDLHKWYATHKDKVAELLRNKAYENNIQFYGLPKPEEMKDLTAAMSVFENVKTCWIKARIRLRPTRNPLYDIVCANCRMEVEAGVDWDVHCSGCSVLSPLEVRLKLPVTLIHNTMELRATLKSPDAEKVCPFTAVEIKKHEEEGVSVVGDISAAMDNKEVVCFMNYYEKRNGGELAGKYVLLKMYTPDEMISFNQGCGSSTCIVAVCEEGLALLGVESRVSTTVNNRLVGVQDGCIKLIDLLQVIDNVFFTGTGKSVVLDIVRDGIVDALLLTSIEKAKSMDEVANIIVETMNQIIPSRFNLNCETYEAIYVILGELNGEYRVYRTGVTPKGRLSVSRWTRRNLNLGSGGELAMQYQRKHKLAVDAGVLDAANYVAMSIARAVKKTQSCGGNIHVAAIRNGVSWKFLYMQNKKQEYYLRTFTKIPRP